MILCRIGIHKWGKYGDFIKSYDGLTQFRRCEKCGRIAYASSYGNQAEPRNKSIDDISKTLPEYK